MLTTEQVKCHSFITVRGDDAPLWFVNGGWSPQTRAGLCYRCGEKANKLSMSFAMQDFIDLSSPKAESICREAIDWERFTAWVNKHDDVSEQDLMMPSEFANAGRQAHLNNRNGNFDTTTGKVKDYNRVVLV